MNVVMTGDMNVTTLISKSGEFCVKQVRPNFCVPLWDIPVFSLWDIPVYIPIFLWDIPLYVPIFLWDIPVDSLGYPSGVFGISYVGKGK